MALPQVAVDRERGVGRRVILHVDAEEAAATRRFARETVERGPAELGVDEEPDMGGLDRDAAFEALALERRDEAGALGDGGFDLLRVMEVLAEESGGGAHPLRGETAVGPHRVVEGDAGDVALRDAEDDGPGDEPEAQRDQSFQAQKRAPSTFLSWLTLAPRTAR